MQFVHGSASRSVLLVLLVIGLLAGSANVGSAAQGGDRDCDDFATQQEAQDYFESRGGSPSNNVDWLDGDGDGIACQTLPRSISLTSEDPASDRRSWFDSLFGWPSMLGLTLVVGTSVSAYVLRSRRRDAHLVPSAPGAYGGGASPAQGSATSRRSTPSPPPPMPGVSTLPASEFPRSGYVPKEVLNTMPYDEYLQTRYWQTVRSNALKRADYKCQLDGRRDLPLHVHHNDYRRRGYERAEDVIVLCEECHEQFHRDGRMPVSASF